MLDVVCPAHRAAPEGGAECGSEELPALLICVSFSGWDSCHRQGSWPSTCGSGSPNLLCVTWQSAVPWQELDGLGAGGGPGQPWEPDQGLHWGVAVPAAEGGQGGSERLLCAGPDALFAQLVCDTAGVHT